MIREDIANSSEELRERIRCLGDDELLRMFHFEHDQYREEALNCAEAEIKRRRLSLLPLGVRKLNQSSETRISWQTVILIVSIVLWLFSFIVLIVTENKPPEGLGLIFAVSTYATILFYWHYAALRRRRGFLQSLEDDERLNERPILYLRSFTDDRKTTRLIGTTTESEQLAMVLDPVGPFISIGAPGEHSPTEVSAVPIYVPDATKWRQSVIGLMKKAQLVILRVGTSPNLLWEVKTALKHVEPGRLILLVPRDQELYAGFRERTKETFQRPLPECDMKTIDRRLIERVFRLLQFPLSLAGLSRSLSLESIIYFARDGKPHKAKIGIDFLRGSPEAPEVPKILRALRPAFDQLGINWRLPRVKFINILLASYAFLQFAVLTLIIFTGLLKFLFGQTESVMR